MQREQASSSGTASASGTTDAVQTSNNTSNKSATIDAAQHAALQAQCQEASAEVESWKGKYQALLVDCEKLTDQLDAMQVQHEVSGVWGCGGVGVCVPVQHTQMWGHTWGCTTHIHSVYYM